MPSNSIFASLNEAQRDAASSVRENTIVLSCPGSGKTKTVESKVVNLLLNHPDSKVCCTTFSREAAKEMESRIFTALPKSFDKKERNRRLKVSTFHALCKQTLEAYYKKSLRIITDKEQTRHILNVASSMGLSVEKKEEIREYISFVDSIPTMTDEKKALVSSDMLELYEEVRKKVRADGKHSFADLLVDTIDLLESGAIPPLPFTHLICDEGQDSDILMYRFLKVHASAGVFITLMLDDDQTLYSFRNSLGVNVCRWLHEDFGARYIYNDTNYRSKEEVLALSRQLIDENEDRLEKGIVSHRGLGGSFTFHKTFNQYDNFELICNIVKDNPGDFFILCRTNFEVQQVCIQLLAENIPFMSNQTRKITDHAVVSSLIELLATLEEDTGDGLDNIFKTYISTKSKNQSKEDDLSKSLKLFDKETLLQCLDYNHRELEKKIKEHDHLIAQSKTDLLELLDMAKVWRTMIDDRQINLAITQASTWLLDRHANEDELSVLEMVVRILKNCRGNTIAMRKIELERFFEESDENKSNDDKVIVMTAHASKGLQRKSVIVWPLREGSYPATYREEDSLVSEQEHMEEERRILYVAMTRAEDNLHLIYQFRKDLKPKKGKANFTEYEPSLFLDDMNLGDEARLFVNNELQRLESV